MSLTMHEYDQAYCDGHYCQKDCEVCQYREENQEEDEDDCIHLRPGEKRQVPEDTVLVERRGVQDHGQQRVRDGLRAGEAAPVVLSQTVSSYRGRREL